MTRQVIERDRLGVLTKIGQGGQGVVHRAPNVKTKFAASMVYKEYKPQTRTEIDFTALAAMPALVEQSLSYAQAERLVSVAAWPCALVEDNGTPTGFVMPAIPEEFFIPLTTVKGSSTSTAEFQHLLNHPSVLAARGINIDDAQRYSLLREVALGLAFVHKHGVCVGDISPKNLLFSLTPHPAVYFIDCDAMRINSVSVLRQVETPGWEVPAGEELATIYSDAYKLGLLALRLLAGDHDTLNPQHLPATTPDLLRQVITDTLTNQPHSRPLPEAWTYVLGNAIEAAQHRQKTAAPAPVSAALDSPPTPVVRSRPPAAATILPATTTPGAPAARNVGVGAESLQYAAIEPAPAEAANAAVGAPYSDPRRPWTVTAAAVIAFLEAALLTPQVAAFGIAGLMHRPLEPPLGVCFLYAFVFLVFLLLFVWGAIVGLRGTNRTVLFIAPVGFVAFLMLVGILPKLSPPGTTAGSDGIDLILMLPIPLLLATRSSREFFHARAQKPL